jgi:hypothetical protein
MTDRGLTGDANADFDRLQALYDALHGVLTEDQWNAWGMLVPPKNGSSGSAAHAIFEMDDHIGRTGRLIDAIMLAGGGLTSSGDRETVQELAIAAKHAWQEVKELHDQAFHGPR